MLWFEAAVFNKVAPPPLSQSESGSGPALPLYLKLNYVTTNSSLYLLKTLLMFYIKYQSSDLTVFLSD